MTDLLGPDMRARAAAIRARRDPSVVGPQHNRAPRPALSPGEVSTSEARVLALVADGHSNREAALQLQLSEETVKSHVKHALARNRACNRTHLAVMFATGRISVVDVKRRA